MKPVRDPEYGNRDMWGQQIEDWYDDDDLDTPDPVLRADRVRPAPVVPVAGDQAGRRP